MKKILVPVDFSKYSSNAFKLAQVIADKAEGEIHLLHVIDGGQFPFKKNDKNLVHEYETHLRETVQRHLDKLLSGTSLEKFKVLTQIRKTHIIDGILMYVEEEAMDMIVMGTRGTEGVEEFLVGSKTEMIVRNAPVPVMTIHEFPEDFKEIRQIVFASDMQDEQDKVFGHIRQFQELFGADLDLLFINTPNHFWSSEDIEQRANRFIEKNNLQNCRVNIASAYNEEEGIVYFIKENHADLLVIGTHQRKGLSHFFIGSLAENLVNRASFPILTIPLK